MVICIFPVVVRMAFTTTQALDNILLRGLTVRTPGNAPISSQYTLYANGQGQTYWSNSLSPANLSSFSTTIGLSISELSSGTYSTIYGVQDQVEFQSTSIATLNTQFLSATTSLIIADSNLNQTFVNQSNYIFDIYLPNLSNDLGVQVNNIYTSTITYVESTLNAVSSYSTFFNEIAYVQSSVNAGLSSLSTSFSLQNASTYSTLTINYNNAIKLATVSSMQFTANQISSLSSVIANRTELEYLSTTLTSSFVSTSLGLQDYISTNDGQTRSSIDVLYTSSIVPLQSSVTFTYDTINVLVDFSTSISSVTNVWISSLVSTSQSIQDAYIFASIGQVSSAILDLRLSTAVLQQQVSGLTAYTGSSIQSLVSTSGYYDKTIKTLQYEFSVITTSSILAGIYDTFMALEGYTSTLIGSTIDTTYTFQSTLYISTTAQNMSISQSFYNAFISTAYTTAASTIIMSTNMYASTLISTLYSTGTTYLVSSFNSSMYSLIDSYYSTTSSLTQAIILSTGTQLQSSILTYLSAPTAAALSTFSTQSASSLSGFNTLFYNDMFTYSTTFNRFFTSSVNSYSTLFISSVGLFQSTNTALSSIITANTALLSTYSTQYGVQLSTQNGVFISSLNSQQLFMQSTTLSTNQSVLSTTTFITNSTVNSLQSSATSSYVVFLAGLTSIASSAVVSSLYTSQTINLSSTVFTGTMDVDNYRNFDVNIYSLCNGLSNYRLLHTPASSALNMRRGIINLNISTVGQAYTNYNSMLKFDAYRWGVPTTVYGAMYPFISNADYVIQYEYTILNQALHTNLLNVYPRLAVRNGMMSATANVSINNAALSSNHFWRGTPIRLAWSNYCYFPYGALGAPPFNPEIVIDVYMSNALVAEYGPYNMSQSSATILAPTPPVSAPVQSVSARLYLLGKASETTTFAFSTVATAFSTIQIRPENYGASGGAKRFIGGSELVMITDGGLYPFGTNLDITVAGTFTQYEDNPLYAKENLVNGLLNRAGYNGTVPVSLTRGASCNITNAFTEDNTNNYADFYINYTGAHFPDMSTLRFYGSQITLTISSASAGYTFVPSTISSIGGSNIYRVFNPNVLKTSNAFASGSNYNMTYRYSPIAFPFLPSESMFIGGTSANNPDPNTQYIIRDINLGGDMVSTLIYYNVQSNAPIGLTSTSGMTIRPTMSFGGNTYASTLVTSSSATQVFRF
jgi:hypothetical protein